MHVYVGAPSFNGGSGAVLHLAWSEIDMAAGYNASGGIEIAYGVDVLAIHTACTL